MSRPLLASTEETRLAGQAERLALNERYAEDLQKELAAFRRRRRALSGHRHGRTLHLFVSAPGRETIHREVTIDRAELAHMSAMRYARSNRVRRTPMRSLRGSTIY